jgi:hypothetical protein
MSASGWSSISEMLAVTGPEITVGDRTAVVYDNTSLLSAMERWSKGPTPAE